MKRRYRPHINPLKASSLIPRGPLVLPAGLPVEVELGCGDGCFVVDLARIHRDRYFVGLDIRSEFLHRGLERIAAENLANVVLEPANFIVDLGHLFAADRIARFWINFPDPLFKARQRMRRWFNAQSAAMLVRALTPGGEIIHQSDVWEPSLDALSILEMAADIRNFCGEFSFHRDRILSTRTTRERQCEEEGRKIWRMRYVKYQ